MPGASHSIHSAADNRRSQSPLRRTLRLSQQEAVASAAMTATSDNFLNAFAVYLHASAVQMGWLTALPQLFGAFWQLLSAWMGNHVRRKTLVVVAALLQALIVTLLALLALQQVFFPSGAWQVTALIALAVGYFSCLNIVQPHWRAWMGSLVPARRRGVFFAKRTSLTMVTSLLVFILGGVLLNYSASSDLTWLGFFVLFAIAASGRFVSGRLMQRMHDPHPSPSEADSVQFRTSLQHMFESLRDPAFRNYSLFVAAMQGTVAISAPFFSVYMLRDLEFTYLQFSLNSIASVATQFLLLKFWGRFSDRFGNRAVMILSSCIIPTLPFWWLWSPNFYYLLGVQMLSGVAWSGFTLCTANYLYDIRPHRTQFALYAAVQSSTSALAVFVGALLGGYAAAHAPALWQLLWGDSAWGSPLFIIFVLSTSLRLAVAAYFLPRLHEPELRRRPDVLQLIYRVARLSAVSGVVLDWMSVTRKSGRSD